MTETDWWTSTDPTAMLAFLRTAGKFSERKARLFAVAVCRRLWHFLEHSESQKDVETAERYAEGRIGYQVMRERQAAATQALWEAGWGVDWHCPAWLVRADRGVVMRAIEDVVNVEEIARSAAEVVGWAAAYPQLRTQDVLAWKAAVRADRIREGVRHCWILRDLFGNPFRPVALHPSWLTPKVVALAQSAHERRQFPRGTLNVASFTLLTDALQEAGCHHEDIIWHCRQWGPVHVLGCWLVDSLLNKE
jgi:hypothetical protein